MGNKLPSFRLKKYHKGYRKGNIIHLQDDNTYGNCTLSQWKRQTRVSFFTCYVISLPDIFEPVEEKPKKVKKDGK